MHLCIKPPKNHQEGNQEGNIEGNLEDNDEKDEYLNCIIENVTHELIQRLKIMCQILCCVPLDKIFPSATRPYCMTEHNEPYCKEQRLYNPNGNGYRNGNGHEDGNGFGNSNGNGNGNGHGNGNGRRWDADSCTSKIRIMERSKKNTNIDNKPSITKSIRNRLHSIRVTKEIEKIDRSIETKSSSIELYSRIDKIRILKELQLTADIDKLIGGKSEKCIRECIDTMHQCIDTRDLITDAVSTTDYPMCADNVAGDGPQIKSRAKPTKMGGFFKRLFKNKSNVRNNKNYTDDVTDCSENEEPCCEFKDLM